MRFLKSWLDRFTGNQFTKTFFEKVGPHLVSLTCVQLLPDGKNKPLVFSGFLLEAAEVWFFVTAGHALEALSEAIERGAVFDRWRLDDQTAGDRFNGAAVVIDFDPDEWAVVNNEELGLDYAALPLRSLYEDQLRAGGALPLRRENWAENIGEYDQFAMVGIPLETVELTGESILFGKVVLLPLEAVDAPVDVERAPEHKLYFRLKDLGGTKDITGMSGCPIFGLSKREANWQYQVIGVQSTWYKDSRVSAASPIVVLAAALEELMRRR
jgi:hypothetical protein